ncbi:MAG: DUF4034 domain-containing protein [Elusimicrobia bacterium]|nr:DUF4034 domain-containing protein [Elusimicrobiota bacterium]
MQPAYMKPLALLLAGGAIYAAAPPKTAWRLGLEKSAHPEDFFLQDSAGKNWNYAQCRGRPTLFLVFTTACPATPDSTALMNGLFERFKDTQLCFIPVASDDGGWATIRPWMDATKIPYPVYYSAGFPNDIWPNFVPAMFLVGRDGAVRKPFQAWSGKKSDIENWILAQLYDGSPESKIPIKSFKEQDPTLEQEYKARDDVLTQSGRLLASHDFAGLDAFAAGLRDRKERLPGGRWKLSSFYDGLADDLENADEAAWQGRLEAINQWIQASSGSVTARVALARVYVEYAWKARGEGYASTVSEENSRAFHDRLAKAREILQEADKLPVKCPELYHTLQRAGGGLGWDRVEFDALYRKAVAFEPDYAPFHIARAWYLQPQWYGSDRELVSAAEDAAQATKDFEGMGLYTRILWYMTVKNYFHPQDLFTATPASWPKMRQGFVDIQKKYPSSYGNLNGFAHFACLAGDKATARKIFDQIGDHYDKDLWGSPAGYMRWRRWADETTLRDRIIALAPRKGGGS